MKVCSYWRQKIEIKIQKETQLMSNINVGESFIKTQFKTQFCVYMSFFPLSSLSLDITSTFIYPLKQNDKYRQYQEEVTKQVGSKNFLQTI